MAREDWERKMLEWISQHQTVVIAISTAAAVLISFVSIILAIATILINRKHNRISVRPLARIDVGDYENRLFVRVESCGVGPLIVSELIIARGHQAIGGQLIDQMPKLPLPVRWSTFNSELKGRALRPGEGVTLLELEGSQQDGKFVQARNDVRRALGELTVKVKYEDMYGKKMKDAERELSWFMRNLSPNKSS